MKTYDDEYCGYLIAYINDYTLTAIYEKTRRGVFAIPEHASIQIDENMPRNERQRVLPVRARKVIDMMIAKKG